MAENFGKIRGSARGWVTRASQKLDSLCNEADPDMIAIQDGVDEFDKRLDALDDVQLKFELTLNTDDQVQADIDTAAQFRDIARLPRIKAVKMLSDANETVPVQNAGVMNNGDGDEIASQGSAPTVSTKLPKLELPSFSGNVTEWTPFWEQFKVSVHNTELPDVSKFTYLRSLLKGEAKAAVSGFALTGDHYHSACDLLQRRFGKREKIIFSHIQELLSWEMKNKASWSMYDKVISHVRSLEVQGIKGEQYGVVLTPLILSRLTQDLRMEWAREGEGHESDLDFLLEFLERELQRRERSQTFSKESQACPGEVSMKRSQPSTAAALHTATQDRATLSCAVCNRTGHDIEHCYDITRGPVTDRKSALRQVGACFRCLTVGQGHSYRRCSGRCKKCKGKHHVVLCDANDKNVEKSVNQSVAVSNVVVNGVNENVSISHVNGTPSNGSVSENVCTSNVNAVAVSSNVILQMARVPVSCPGRGGTVDAIALFDTGADRTYVTQAFVERVKPKWVGSQPLAQAVFGSDVISEAQSRNLYQLNLVGQAESVNVVAAEVPTVCTPLLRPTVPQQLLQSFGPAVQFIDFPEGQEVKVDLLIGLDFYWRLMTCSIIRATNGLVAQCSIFGWLLSGPMQGPVVSDGRNVSHQLFCNTISESGLKNFWDLESLGIKDSESPTENSVWNQFEKSVCVSSTGRYEVALPWKSESVKSKLLDNERSALNRLNSLSVRLGKAPELSSRYHTVFSDMLQDGVIEEVPEDEMVGPKPIFYMPHRPVVKESSVTTKIRPVFDASARGYNGVTLNDLLETGPSLIPNLPGILLRFRRWKVALSADVSKAFHQIEVCKEDRDVHRFLWDDKGTVRRMRFLRVPFGNKSSPFLLNATLRHHLSRFSPSRVVSELSDNLYVDDWLSGCDDDSECCEMLKEAIEVMDQAKMSLAKWGSNSDEVGNLLCREFQDKSVCNDSLKVLGMRWMSTQDCFSFDGISVTGELCVTKRVVLSFISRLFDPLGLLSPFVMVVKCLFQELWRLGANWDEVVPAEFSDKFLSWVHGFVCLKRWMVPRSYLGVPWRDIVRFQLQGFGDASQSGYGACVYLHVQLKDGSWRSSLVIARAKVAPLKKLSLPRLELLGALLCARLVIYTKQELKFPDEVTCHCWTDSMVTLAWIKSDPHRWKTFVGNRVAEIQSLISPSQWRHCPGFQNPADLVTRGISAEELVKSRLWVEGPPFLLDNSGDHVSMEESSLMATAEGGFDHVLLSVAQEMETSASEAAEEAESEVGPVLDLTRFSKFKRLVRVVGWVYRFLHNCRVRRDQRKQGNLSQDELKGAGTGLLQYVQKQEFPREVRALRKGQPLPKGTPLRRLDPFLCEDGLVRVQGRLQFSDLSYDSVHPIIVPKGHLGLLLARQVHQDMKHAGVNSMLTELRNRYWLIGARRLCKGVKRDCFACKYLDATAASQPMAPLPEMRVTRSNPFAVTGIDHGGPLFCCDFVGRKFYILLFTCAVTRAVHLELVDSLSGETTVLALRRFIARRGLPSVIMSDNARGFCAARDLLLSLYSEDCPKWMFNPPRAPWWGGWWERLIGSTKSALKRSIGKRTLSRTELETILHEIEACLNSRPLTFVGDDLDMGTVLTPAHFLLGRSGSTPAELVDPVVSSDDLFNRKELRTSQMDKFWSCWSDEYIRNLPPCRGPPSKGCVQEGSVVLVREDRVPRLRWPLAVVTGVHPGRDGLVRCVEVKTARGVLKRPIQRIHDLEITDDSNDIITPLPTPNPIPNSVPNLTENVVQNTATIDNEVVRESQAVNDEVDSESVNQNVRITRSGRSVKPPVVLDL